MTSILGSPPDLRPELYTNDAWVEFIDLDFEEQSDKLTNLDTDFLMDRSLFSNCSHLSMGFRDDDSGRASCCDPDLASDAETSHLHSLVTNQIRNKEPATASRPGCLSPNATAGEPPSEVPAREALYTQVSEIKPSGKVLLSPEDDMQNNAVTEAKETQTAGKKEDKNNPEPHVTYTSELNAGKMSPSLPECNFNDLCPTGEDLSSSSVRTSNSIPASQQTPSKAITTPDGYLTPDLLGSITP